MITKVCTKCKAEKVAGLKNYAPDDRKKDGLQSQCRECKSEKKRAPLDSTGFLRQYFPTILAGKKYRFDGRVVIPRYGQEIGGRARIGGVTASGARFYAHAKKFVAEATLLESTEPRMVGEPVAE